MKADSHRLRPDHHPTPFSADEIREASRPGRTVRFLVERKGAEPAIRVSRFVGGDAEGGDGESWMETLDGERLSEPERGRSTWLELQGHASMPLDTTTVEEETFEVPAGTYAGWRYTRTDGDEVDTFWFAKAAPGMPLRIESRVGGDVVFSSTAIEDVRP